MDRQLKLTVTPEMEGKTVKDVARSVLLLSSTRLKKAKQMENGITVNGQSVFVTRVLHAGDEVCIVLEQANAVSENVTPVQGELDIAYEDDFLLVINKPPHMPVHPSAGHSDDSLANLVVGHYGSFVFRPVNRLDAGTSGLMVVAKDAHVHALLGKQLHTGEFERLYWAVAEGHFVESEGVVDAPIARAEGSAIRRVVDPSGQRAVTRYRVLQSNSRFSLVELQLETGRTHQIRVHLSSVGHPLAGDFLYGTEDVTLIDRAALHSHALTLRHPMTGETLHLETQLPQDMQRLMEEWE